MSDKRPRLSCAVLLKEADRHLPGWLAWHLSLGIAHIAVIDAGPYDDARQIIRSYQPDWPISWLPVELPETTPAETRRLELTRHALAHLRMVTGTMEKTIREEGEDGSVHPAEDWVLILDGDEYFCPEHDLGMFFSRAGDEAAAIALHWRIHGSAGHLRPPQGHVITNHPWHALPDFPDHRFARLLARLEYLPESSQLADPITLDLPPDWVIRADGQPWQPDEASVLSSPWAEGCIQHYICPQAHGEEELPPAMRSYYDRNEQMAPPPQHKLLAMRRVANGLQENALLTGLARLKDLARQQLKDRLEQKKGTDGGFLADHTRHETFLYGRVQPPFAATLLENAQYSPRYTIGQSVILRSLEGQVLTSDLPERNLPFIGFWQKTTPHLLTLCPQEEGPAMLGDSPSPFGTLSLRITTDPQQQAIYLPHETGQGDVPMEMLPATAPFPMLFTPLPPADEADGLSVQGLLMWVAGHPGLTPQDLQRALLLLSPTSTQHMRRLAPMLGEFFPSSLNRPAFLPQ